MRRGLVFCVCFVVFMLRWVSLASPLPATWTPESRIRFTATILERPEHTDTQTIVRMGVWYIPVRGYAAIIPGSVVAFSGTVSPRVQMGQVTRIVMVDPTFEVLADPDHHQLRAVERVVVFLTDLRERWVSLLEKFLPEPMASLAAGILLGVKREMPTDFYQALVNTGTLHVIAASGFNVSVVLTVTMQFALTFIARGWAIVVGIIGVVLYIIIAGGGASVVRAAVMGSLTLVAFYYGRPVEARRLVWLSAFIMLLVQPLLILDVGFQLSFAATLGLLYLEPWVSRVGNRVSYIGHFGIQRYLSNYLYPTLAATLSTLPIILWHFGRASWISPLVNILILPLVPLIMGLTAATIILGLVTPSLGQLLAWLLYPALWWMVTVIRLFG